MSSGQTVEAASSSNVAQGGGAVSGSGGDDGNDENNRPFAKIQSEPMDDVIAEEEEEESSQLDQLTATPRSAQIAPSAKGRSPAHRQIRNQRNARKILDTWMAEDDPVELRNDCKDKQKIVSFFSI